MLVRGGFDADRRPAAMRGEGGGGGVAGGGVGEARRGP